MTKEIKWSKEEMKALRAGHVYNDMTAEINESAKRLADENAVDEWTAKIIVVMLMNCGSYTTIRTTRTRIEFKFGDGNADVMDEDCVVTTYVLGTKAFRTELKNYVNDLFGYLRQSKKERFKPFLFFTNLISSFRQRARLQLAYANQYFTMKFQLAHVNQHSQNANFCLSRVKQ